MKPFTLLVFCFIFAIVNAQKGPPSGKPRKVKVEPISESSLYVTWNSPLKSDPSDETIGYYVGIKPSTDLYGPYNFKNSDCSNNNCSLELTNLKTYTQYSVNVQAFNAQGAGPRNDDVNQYTAQGIPDSPPSHINCKALSSTELRVSWERPPTESLHGILKSYSVTYSPTNRFYYNEEERVHKTTSNETILRDLKKNTEYAITVLASNSLHDGYQSETIECRTQQDVPDEPVDVKVIVYGTEKVSILWHAPLSRASGEILCYTIYYRKSGSKAKKRKVMRQYQTSYEIFGLEPNEPYEFWVTATSEVGQGPASKYLTATPSNQTSPKISTYNDTITVEFKEKVMLPCDAVGSPSPNVTWKFNGDNLILNKRLQISANGSLIIQSVIREDANNYTCFAENAFGNDSITHKLSVRAPPRSPEVTVLSTTTDEITLQLKPNRKDSSKNSRFTLYFKLDSEIEVWYKVERVHSEYKIEHCICGSPYLVYARGYNYDEDEYGEASEILTVGTNGSEPIAPTMSDFLEPSVEGVTLNLLSWKADSCPISHFFVEYKEKKNIDWIRIRNKLRPYTDFVLNLEPATLYDIRVTAYNAAGTTVADYGVAALNENAGTIAPPSISNELPDAEESTKQP